MLCTRLLPYVALFWFVLTGILWAETPCGQETPCTIEGGDYHLVFPTGWDGATPLPALVFFHGHNSSSRSIFRAGSLRRDFAEQGYLLIAPNGARFAGRNTRGWPAREGVTDARDDIAFTLAVLDDAAARVPIDPARVFAGGFSAGGSMAWRLACYGNAAGRFAGFVSVSGALRRPIPDQACPTGPIRMLHIHGFTDRQVPLEGRGIRDWHQGDVFESLGLARATNDCRSNPDRIWVEDGFRCRDWSASCQRGGLRLCLHDGGHGLPRGWTARARAYFENEEGS
jgi:polyhydroxybutyrate depolymerase